MVESSSIGNDPPMPRPFDPSATSSPRSTEESATRTVDNVGLQAATSPELPGWWLAGGVAALVLAFSWDWLRRNRQQVVVALGGAVRDVDSGDFMRALRIWNSVVVSHDPTPRHVKRFYNRARLFSAYEQQVEVAEHEKAGAKERQATPDDCLVALAAMHHLDPSLLDEFAGALERHDRHSTRPIAPDDTAWQDELLADTSTWQGGPAQRTVVLSAWRAHLRSFHRLPTPEQVRRFASRLEGIQVR